MEIGLRDKATEKIERLGTLVERVGKNGSKQFDTMDKELGRLEVTVEKAVQSYNRLRAAMVGVMADPKAEGFLTKNAGAIQSQIRQLEEFFNRVRNLKTMDLANAGIADSLSSGMNKAISSADRFTRTLLGVPAASDRMRNALSAGLSAISQGADRAKSRLVGLVMQADALRMSLGSIKNPFGGMSLSGIKNPFAGMSFSLPNFGGAWTAVKDMTSFIVSFNKSRFSQAFSTMGSNIVSATRHLRDFGRGVGEVATAVSRAEGMFGRLGERVAAAFSIDGIRRFMMSVIEIGGAIEQQHIAMQNIFGDIQKGDQMFSKLKGLALESPFTFGDLTKDVKQLAAYGVEYENLYETTKRLADVSSGLGVSFERIALAYGQTKARTWLDAKELRQFAYAGIPMLQKLSELYSKRTGEKVSTSQVRDMMKKRQVSFEDVKQVFTDLTNEGGQFYNMQLVLSETLLGRFNKLKDAWEIMLSDFASGENIIGGTLITILNALTSIIQAAHKVAPALAVAFGAAKAIRYLGFGPMAGRLGSSKFGELLSEKQKMARYVDWRLANGRPITAEQQDILTTRGKLTKDDYRRALEQGKLNKLELNRLYINGQIEKSMYRQVAAQNNLVHANSKFTAIMQNALGRVGGIASGLWTMIGGLPGLLVGGGLALGTYLYQGHKESEARVENMKKGIVKHVNDLQTYLNNNPIKLNVTIGEVREQIEDYKKQLSDTLGSGIATNIISRTSGMSESERLSYIKREADAYAVAARNVGQYAKAFETALNASDKYDFQMAVPELDNLLKNYEEQYNKYVNKKGKFPVTTNITIDRSIKEFAKSLIDSGIDVASDGGRRMFYVLREQFINTMKSSDNMTDFGANVFRVKLSQALGIDDMPEYIDEVSRRAIAKVNDNTIVTTLQNGGKLSDAQKQVWLKAYDAAVKEVIKFIPPWSQDIRKALESEDFRIKIQTQIAGGNGGSTGYGDKIIYAKGISDAIKGIAGNWAKDAKDISDVWEEAKKAIDDSKKKADAATEAFKQGRISKEDYDEAVNRYANEKAAAKAIGYNYDGSNKPGGDRGDEQLKSLNKRSQALQRYIELYRDYVNLYGEKEAKSRIGDLKKLGFEGYDLSKPAESMKKMRGEFMALYKAKKTDDRESAYNTANEKYERQLLKDETEAVIAIAKARAEINAEMQRTYQLQSKIRSKLGESLTGSIMGANAKSGTYVDYLKKSISGALGEKGISLSRALGMNEDQLKDLFGDKNGVKDILKEIRKERQDIEQLSVEAVAAQYEKLQGTEAQLRAIEADLAETWRNITKNSGAKQGDTSGLTRAQSDAWSIAQIEADTKKMKLSKDYIDLFAGAWSMTNEEIAKVSNAIQDNLNKQLNAGMITLQQYTAEVEKLQSAMLAINTDAISGAFSNFTLAARRRQLAGNMMSQGYSQYTLTGASAQRYGYADGTTITLSQLINDIEKAEEGFEKNLNRLSAAFKGLETVMSPAINYFKAIGKEGMGNVVGGVSGAISSGVSAFGAMKDVSGMFKKGSGMANLLSAAGPWAAAASAAFSVAGSIAAAHDEALQKEIEASKQRQKEMEYQYNKLNNLVTNGLGGIYSNEGASGLIAANEKMFKKMTQPWVEYTKDGSVTSATAKSYASKEAREAMEEARKSGSSYDAMRANMILQRDEMQHQLDKEQDKKKKDKSAISDYKMQIDEMNQKIKDYALDMAKQLYGIDFKQWAQQLSDAISEAWVNGRDAALAYEDAVKDVMRNLAKTVAQQAFMEPLLKDAESKIISLMKTSDGAFGVDEIVGIFTEIASKGEDATRMTQAFYEQLKEMGLDLHDYSTSGGTLGNNVQNVTENTADLLGGYIDAIRMYVAEDNLILKDFADKYLDNTPSWAQTQIDHLNNIVTNTANTVGKLEEIYNILDQVTSPSRVRQMNIN